MPQGSGPEAGPPAAAADNAALWRERAAVAEELLSVAEALTTAPVGAEFSAIRDAMAQIGAFLDLDRVIVVEFDDGGATTVLLLEWRSPHFT